MYDHQYQSINIKWWRTRWFFLKRKNHLRKWYHQEHDIVNINSSMMYIKIRLHQDDNISSTNHHLINQSRIHDEDCAAAGKFYQLFTKKKKVNSRILPVRGGWYRVNLNNATVIELELTICRNICLDWRETHYVYRTECLLLWWSVHSIMHIRMRIRIYL